MHVQMKCTAGQHLLLNQYFTELCDRLLLMSLQVTALKRPRNIQLQDTKYSFWKPQLKKLLII